MTGNKSRPFWVRAYSWYALPSEAGTCSMIPHATNFLRRALRMFFANPKLFSKSENRRMPERASRTISSDHHSPMVSSERATGHRLALKDLCRIVPRIWSQSWLHHYTMCEHLIVWLHHATRLGKAGRSTDP